MKTVNLDALASMQFKVELRGNTYRVRAMTTRIASMIDAATAAEGEAKLVAFHDAIAAILPDMSREIVEDLEPSQMMEILNLSRHQVDIVEEAAADPNVASSAPETTTELLPAT